MSNCHHLQCPQAVICIQNISWDLSKNEVIDFLNPVCSIPRSWIHIPIDINSGKTKPDIFVEVPTTYDGINCASSLNNRILKGRLINVRLCSEREVLFSFFPYYFIYI